MLTTINYNLKIALLFNINTAVLLSYIGNLKIEESGEIIVSREEVFKNTGLEETSQQDSEHSLSKSNLIQIREFRNNKNKYYCKINKELLNKVMISDKPKTELPIDNMAQLVRPTQQKLSKTDIVKNNLKKRIKEPDPVIQTYYIQWIDSVYENPKGYLTSGAVEIAQKELSVFSKGDQKIKIDVLNIAIKNGWRDISWAINRYNENKGTNSKTLIHFNDYNTIKSSKDNIGGEAF